MKFRNKLQNGQPCFGTIISFSDSTVTEALCQDLDFVWIDMEHSPLTLDAVQGHVMATSASNTTALVRVAWNDPVLIKPVLDLGAQGVIVPLVKTAAEAHRAVAACRYPPNGIRGFGPRRASHYGRLEGPDFCRNADQKIMTIVQIEDVESVKNIDDIVAVPGVSSIVIGPNDLAVSIGHPGESEHPQVTRAIETVISAAVRAKVPIGIGTGCRPELVLRWLNMGVHWVAIGSDCDLMLQALDQVSRDVGGYLRTKLA